MFENRIGEPISLYNILYYTQLSVDSSRKYILKTNFNYLNFVDFIPENNAWKSNLLRLKSIIKYVIWCNIGTANRLSFKIIPARLQMLMCFVIIIKFVLKLFVLSSVRCTCLNILCLYIIN